MEQLLDIISPAPAQRPTPSSDCLRSNHGQFVGATPRACVWTSRLAHFAHACQRAMMGHWRRTLRG